MNHAFTVLGTIIAPVFVLFFKQTTGIELTDFLDCFLIPSDVAEKRGYVWQWAFIGSRPGGCLKEKKDGEDDKRARQGNSPGLPLLHALDVPPFGGIDLNFVTFTDKGGHVNDESGL